MLKALAQLGRRSLMYAVSAIITHTTAVTMLHVFMPSMRHIQYRPRTRQLLPSCLFGKHTLREPSTGRLHIYAGIMLLAMMLFTTLQLLWYPLSTHTSLPNLQAQQMSKAVRSLPRSLAQWLPTTRQHSNPPASRLAHVLLRHFQPPQSGQQPHGYAASASSNPKMAPSAAAATTMQQQLQSSQALAKQKQGGGRKAARAASALLRGRDERSSAVAAAAMKAPAGPEIPTWVATRERPPSGRLPSPERRPQSAGSNAAPAAKGEPAAKGKTKPRARSTSPNSQYHFSCTSSVPDHGSSCFGEAASLALQDWSNTGKTQNDLRKGREPTQLPARQAGGATGPMHTTYVLSQQHEMLPKFMPDAKDIQQPRTEQKAESRQQQQQQQRRQQMRGDKFGSDVQEAAAAASLKTSPGELV